MAGLLSTNMAAGPPAAKRTRLAKKTSGWYLAMLESMGGEDGCANQLVYLVTVSRVLPGNVVGYRDLGGVTTAEMIHMIRNAFDNPLDTGSAGAPRRRTDSPLDFVIWGQGVAR